MHSALCLAPGARLRKRCSWRPRGAPGGRAHLQCNNAPKPSCGRRHKPCGRSPIAEAAGRRSGLPGKTSRDVPSAEGGVPGALALTMGRSPSHRVGPRIGRVGFHVRWGRAGADISGRAPPKHTKRTTNGEGGRSRGHCAMYKPRGGCIRRAQTKRGQAEARAHRLRPSPCSGP
jgi:hypothetical protein